MNLTTTRSEPHALLRMETALCCVPAVSAHPMQILPLLLTAIALLLAAPTPASACSCLDPLEELVLPTNRDTIPLNGRIWLGEYKDLVGLRETGSGLEVPLTVRGNARVPWLDLRWLEPTDGFKPETSYTLTTSHNGRDDDDVVFTTDAVASTTPPPIPTVALQRLFQNLNSDCTGPTFYGILETQSHGVLNVCVPSASVRKPKKSARRSCSGEAG